MDLTFGVLATLSCALLVWQWLAARKFPLHKKIADATFTPAISILKPLKGCDGTTRDSLQSWLRQNYGGQVEVLFGVADAKDPACEIVQTLLAENPSANARLVVCKDLKGMNAKAAKLAQLELLAKHELILICDADVRVPLDFLANFVAPLRDEKNGLVNCFYRLANPVTTAMQWEAVAINADFWSQVLQAQMLKPLDFALGAAILVRRKALAEIGGFAALADCLADDYQLGNRIAEKGHRIALCPVVVECWDAPMNWQQVWRHQLRWARTIRVCQPLPYFFSLLSNATFWAVTWLAAEFVFGCLQRSGPASASGPWVSIAFPYGALAGLVFILIRIGVAQDLQRRFSPGQKLISQPWLVLAKDILNAAIWLCAFMGNTVEWRGRRMKLRRDGTLVEKG